MDDRAKQIDFEIHCITCFSSCIDRSFEEAILLKFVKQLLIFEHIVEIISSKEDTGSI